MVRLERVLLLAAIVGQSNALLGINLSCPALGLGIPFPIGFANMCNDNDRSVKLALNNGLTVCGSSKCIKEAKQIWNALPSCVQTVLGNVFVDTVGHCSNAINILPPLQPPQVINPPQKSPTTPSAPQSAPTTAPSAPSQPSTSAPSNSNSNSNTNVNTNTNANSNANTNTNSNGKANSSPSTDSNGDPHTSTSTSTSTSSNANTNSNSNSNSNSNTASTSNTNTNTNDNNEAQSPAGGTKSDGSSASTATVAIPTVSIAANNGEGVHESASNPSNAKANNVALNAAPSFKGAKGTTIGLENAANGPEAIEVPNGNGSPHSTTEMVHKFISYVAIFGVMVGAVAAVMKVNSMRKSENEDEPVEEAVGSNSWIYFPPIDLSQQAATATL